MLVVLAAPLLDDLALGRTAWSTDCKTPLDRPTRGLMLMLLLFGNSSSVVKLIEIIACKLLKGVRITPDRQIPDITGLGHSTAWTEIVLRGTWLE